MTGEGGSSADRRRVEQGRWEPEVEEGGLEVTKQDDCEEGERNQGEKGVPHLGLRMARKCTERSEVFLGFCESGNKPPETVVTFPA